jgi:hypothetical protein
MPAESPLLIDVSCLSCEATDAALEDMVLAKAIGDDDDGIWDAHPNPFVRRIVELFTDRGLERIEGLKSEFERWLRGEEFREGLTRPVRPEGAMARWSASELGTVRLYLESLPSEAWRLEDWLLLVDFLVQRYLPEGDLRTEASWLATRSAMMGRVQAAADLGEAEVDTILQRPDFGDLAGPSLPPDLAAAITFGRERCCENVTALSDSVRHRMRRLIVDYQEAIFTGDRAAAAEGLQMRLLDEFGTMNRDWRRIAVTEATENVNQGMVASIEPGKKLKRVERYRGACAFCRSIDGRVVTVVEPSRAKKNGDTEVWVGKTNVGRSASPRKRQGGQLVERKPEEMWWVASGAQHPHCRGSWVRVTASSPDPEFDAWLARIKGKPE